MNILSVILLIFLIACAAAASLAKNLLHTVLIFMSFGTIMAIIWLLLEAPDLAITEAAVGVGVDAVLYFLTLKKLGKLSKEEKHE